MNFKTLIHMIMCNDQEWPNVITWILFHLLIVLHKHLRYCSFHYLSYFYELQRSPLAFNMQVRICRQRPRKPVNGPSMGKRLILVLHRGHWGYILVSSDLASKFQTMNLIEGASIDWWGVIWARPFTLPWQCLVSLWLIHKGLLRAFGESYTEFQT